MLSFVRIIGLFLLSIYLNSDCLAQQHIFKNYTVNDGLAANSIRNIFQDSKGFLWIATWEGLSFYDGHKFTNFNSANGLAHDLINDVCEEKDGSIYIASNDGSIALARNYRVQEKNISTGTVVNKFIHSPAGNIIAITDHKGFQHFKAGKLAQVPGPFQNTSYFNLSWIDDTLFAAVTSSSIQLFSHRYKLIAEIQNELPVYGEDAKIFQDSKKRIWAATPGGLKLISPSFLQTGKIELLTPPAPFNNNLLLEGPVRVIFEEANGILWMGTGHGLVKIHPEGTVKTYTVQNGLPSDYISVIFQDREKNIWIGTALGLAKITTHSGIQLYSTETGLVSNGVIFLHPLKDDYLLAGTRGGAQVLNTTTGNTSTPGTDDNSHYYDVVQNSNPPVLVGLKSIVPFDTVALRFSKAVPLPVPHNTYYHTTTDNEGNMFFGSTEKLYFMSQVATGPELVMDQHITCLMMDRSKRVWAGTQNNGMFCISWKMEGNKINIIKKENFISNEPVRCIFQDSRGSIWAGTRFNGMFQLLQNTDGQFSVKHFSRTEGLSSNWVKSIAEDAKGNIWAVSFQSLDKLIPQKGSFRIFNFSKANHFTATITQIKAGRKNDMWLATGEGITHIRDGETENLSPLPVHITSISSPGRQLALDGNKLRLNYRRNQLRFEFSSPGFINEKQILYSFRLSGSGDDSWSNPSNEHTVSFASLRPGSYSFEVRTLGWNGEWGPVTGFGFEIRPPFWQSWWFILLSTILLVAVIYMMVRKRIAAIRHEAELKNKISETEMMALRAQMNPHFIFNCINSIDALIQSNDKYNATVYLNKFARLIRNILDSSKQNKVSFSKDMETLRLYVEMEQFRNENKFTAEIKAEDLLVQDDYKVPPLIIQPYVENAIVHGLRNRKDNKGRLIISAIRQNGHLKYTIEDNGIGRQASALLNSKEKTSYGIEMSNDRVKLFNRENQASVQVQDLLTDGKPVGTRVEVFLKLQ